MSQDNIDNTDDGTNAFEVYTEETYEDLQQDNAQQETEGKPNKGKADDKAAEGKADEDKKPNAEGDKTSGSDDDDKPKQTGGKRSRRFEKRIARLTKRAKENSERATKAEQELQQAKAELEKLKAEKSKPKRDDYSSSDDYDKDLEKWAKEQGSKGDQTEGGNKKPPANEEFQDALEDVLDAFDESKDRFKDFDKVVHGEDAVFTEQMVITLSDSDDPAAVAYYLGQNKDEAKKIADLTPAKQARAIAKLEARLEAESQADGDTAEKGNDSKEEKPTESKNAINKHSNAPPPINPLKGTDSGEKDEQDMSFNEFEQHRASRQRRRGKFW